MGIAAAAFLRWERRQRSIQRKDGKYFAHDAQPRRFYSAVHMCVTCPVAQRVEHGRGQQEACGGDGGVEEHEHGRWKRVDDGPRKQAAEGNVRRAAAAAAAADLPAVGGRKAEVTRLFLDLGRVPSQGVTLLH